MNGFHKERAINFNYLIILRTDYSFHITATSFEGDLIQRLSPAKDG